MNGLEDRKRRKSERGSKALAAGWQLQLPGKLLQSSYIAHYDSSSPRNVPKSGGASACLRAATKIGDRKANTLASAAQRQPNWHQELSRIRHAKGESRQAAGPAMPEIVEAKPANTHASPGLLIPSHPHPNPPRTCQRQQADRQVERAHRQEAEHATQHQQPAAAAGQQAWAAWARPQEESSLSSGVAVHACGQLAQHSDNAKQDRLLPNSIAVSDHSCPVCLLAVSEGVSPVVKQLGAGEEHQDDRAGQYLQVPGMETSTPR